MDSAVLKKWVVLASLLGLTLVLVWQAPAPDQADIVEASKSVEQVARSQPAATIASQDKSEIRLNPRQPGGETVDLFAAPVTRQPVTTPVINRPVEVKPEKTVELPFRYVGMFQSAQKTTFFVMDGPRLYLVQEGDTVNQDFRLQRIDYSNKELIWTYLPLNETRKMSMEQ